MDDATMNKLYGWKGRVHKAIKVFEQCKTDYVRVCALPKTTNTLKGTSCDHDANIALTWVLLESSRKILNATCDAYIVSIKNYFHAYRVKQDDQAVVARGASSSTITSATTGIGTDTDTTNETTAAIPAMTIWIEGVVENTVNSHVKFIEQWRGIISDAQKEAGQWRNDHQKSLDMMWKIGKGGKMLWIDPDCSSDDKSEYDNDGDDDDSVEDDDDDSVEDDDDDSENDDPEYDIGISNDNSHMPFDELEERNPKLELLRMGMRFDKHADRLFQLGTYVSAGKVLISSLKIADKLDSIEKAAQKAGHECIMGLTQRNLRVRQVIPGTATDNLDNIIDNIEAAIGEIHSDEDEAEESRDQAESTVVEEWKNRIDTTKVNAIYSWYRMYHGTLKCIDLKHL